MVTRGRLGLRGAALAAALALAATGCAGRSAGRTPPGATAVTGGTAVLAEPPSVTPNYVFPFASSAYFSTINTWNLQSLLYRPLTGRQAVSINAVPCQVGNWSLTSSPP